MKLELDRGQESALAFLLQACWSDRLLSKAGCTPEQEAVLAGDLRRVDAQLLGKPPDQVTIPHSDFSTLLAAAAILAALPSAPAAEAVRSRLGDLLARYDVRLDVT